MKVCLQLFIFRNILGSSIDFYNLALLISCCFSGAAMPEGVPIRQDNPRIMLPGLTMLKGLPEILFNIRRIVRMKVFDKLGNVQFFSLWINI